jgi:8-oxo-dGTP pyrophosphatase MutT (NUDIX family)
VVDSESTPLTLTLTTGEDEPSRSAAVAKTTFAMRETRHFKVLDKWRDELYPIYGPGGELLFTIERSASPLFGIVQYGVHMTAYTKYLSSSTGEEEYKIWTPRRSATKQTYPSLLDNSVAGGMAAGEEPFQSIVREALEEASLPSDLVKRKVKAAGCVTYFHIRDANAGGETGLLVPECQYIFDLDLSGEKGEDGSDVICKPNDEEVEAFELLGLTEVRKRLAAGEYKHNCAVVLLDFLIRHGLITKEDEKDFVEICARLHRLLEFPLG